MVRWTSRIVDIDAVGHDGHLATGLGQLVELLGDPARTPSSCPAPKSADRTEKAELPMAVVTTNSDDPGHDDDPSSMHHERPQSPHHATA